MHAHIIATSLRSSHLQLQCLSLKNNFFTDSGIRAIEDELRMRNYNLQMVMLDGNEWVSDDMRRRIEALGIENYRRSCVWQHLVEFLERPNDLPEMPDSLLPYALESLNNEYGDRALKPDYMFRAIKKLVAKKRIYQELSW